MTTQTQTEIDSIFESKPSHKYLITPETTHIRLNYVFAASEADAREKAHQLLDIPAGEPIEVQRISDFTGLKLRLN